MSVPFARSTLASGALLSVLLGVSGAGAEPAFDPSKELLRIAKMKQDDRLLASFAESRGRTVPNLTEKELFLIVDTVERVGSPDHAIRMLQDRVKRFPKDLDARVSLAKMYVRASQSGSAIPVWKELAAKLGLTPPLAMEYARVLSTTGDHAGGLAVLVSIKDKAPDDALDYWRDLAVSAWDQDDTKTALVAYKKVWNADPPLPAASSRLMQLLAEAGEIDEAIVVAKQALAREKNPAHLLFVARLQVKRGEVAAAKRTLDLADDQRALVASTLEYWMLRAEVLSRLGELDGARDAHRVALRLDPNAPGVRAALLWDSIDRNDLRRLAADLHAWAPDAVHDHEMWGPTAIGLDRIGRTRDAIRFFVLQAKETPNDDLWMLEFSDALARVGEESVARNLRRKAYSGIRSRALAALRRTAPTPAAASPLAAPAPVPAGVAPPPPQPAPKRVAGKRAPAPPAAPAPTPTPTPAPVLPAQEIDSSSTTPSALASAAEKLSETHVFLTQQFRGEPEAERLVERMLATDKPSLALEEFAVGWYLQEGNVDRARRHLARARLKRLERGSARRYALLIAMADDDRIAIDHLLETPNDLSDGEKATAYLRLERDDRAVAPILAMLDHADLGSGQQGGTPLVPAETDAPTLRKELRAIDERTSPAIRAGGRFTYINDLLIAGPSVGGAYPLGANRLILTAGANQFDDLKTSSVFANNRREADALAVVRNVGVRHITEYRAGVDYQTGKPSVIPLPRLGYAGTFRILKNLGGAVDVTVNGRIEDTSFLRIAGLRDSVTGDLVYEPLPKVYVLGTVIALEDHTRTFEYLGLEAGGGIEAGYKLLEKVPEWTVGARFGAYGRTNRADIPEDYRGIVKPNEGRSSLYPPSYQQAMVVMRLARGDFFERSRQELVSFPRYDCEADAGVLVGIGIRRTKPAGAAAVRCALSIRVPWNGYFSLSAEYIKGVTGLARADNALGSLTFTQFLR